MSSPSIIGMKVTGIRRMTKHEMRHEGWEKPTTVLELEEGVFLFASQDDEGNGPGTLFGSDKDGDGFYVMDALGE